MDNNNNISIAKNLQSSKRKNTQSKQRNNKKIDKNKNTKGSAFNCRSFY